MPHVPLQPPLRQMHSMLLMYKWLLRAALLESGALLNRTEWLCYTEKAELAQQHPGIKTTINPADENCKK